MQTIITVLITGLISIGYYNLFWHITEWKKNRGKKNGK